MKYGAGDRTVSLAPRPERAPRLAQPGGAPGGAPGASQVQQLDQLAEAGERTRQESGHVIGRKAHSAYGQGPKHDTGRSSAEILGREERRRDRRRARQRRGGAPPLSRKGASLRSRVLAILAMLGFACAWLRVAPRPPLQLSPRPRREAGRKAGPFDPAPIEAPRLDGPATGATRGVAA